MENFDLKKYLSENKLTSNSKILAEAESKILSQEFGGTDDVTFLRVVWKMSIEDLEKLLEETLSDLKWTKNLGAKGKIMGIFNRRNIQLLNFRIKLLKQVIESKRKNPEYIPDSFK
jgi:hypothetical protein